MLFLYFGQTFHYDLEFSTICIRSLLISTSGRASHLEFVPRIFPTASVPEKSSLTQFSAWTIPTSVRLFLNYSSNRTFSLKDFYFCLEKCVPIPPPIFCVTKFTRAQLYAHRLLTRATRSQQIGIDEAGCINFSRRIR